MHHCPQMCGYEPLFAHLVETLLSRVLGVLGDLRVVHSPEEVSMKVMLKGWENIRLEATSNVVGVLFAGGGVDVAAIELLIEHFLGVLLGLFGGIWKCQKTSDPHG